MAEMRSGISRFLVGMFLGAIAALMFAPKSGKETRQQLREQADEMYEDNREKIQEQGKRALEVISGKRDMAAQRIDELKHRIQQTKEEVAASTGREKQRAMKEAQALEEQVQDLTK